MQRQSPMRILCGGCDSGASGMAAEVGKRRGRRNLLQLAMGFRKPSLCVHAAVNVGRLQVTVHILTGIYMRNRNGRVRRSRKTWPHGKRNHQTKTTYIRMKKHYSWTLALATMAGVVLSTSQATADPYADGDLILGFRATAGNGGSTNILVNLGSIATFRDANTQISLDLGNLDADLDATFGANWATRADFLWSVSGVQFSAGNGFSTNRNLIASRAQNSPLAQPGFSNSLPWNRGTLSTQGPPALKMQALANQYGLGTTGSISGTDQIESVNSPFALIQPHGQNNSFEEFMSGGGQSSSGSSFAYFSGGIEGNFGLGASGSALDLYVMTPAATGGGTFEGTFTIDDSAHLTFTPQGVPEPSSIFTLALGTAALGIVRRRARVNN
jgi:hypothetical protein